MISKNASGADLASPPFGRPIGRRRRIVSAGPLNPTLTTTRHSAINHLLPPRLAHEPELETAMAYNASIDTDDSAIPRAIRRFLRNRLLEVAGLAILVAVLTLAVALTTWSNGDPSFSNAVDGPVANWLGRPGAIVADGSHALVIDTGGNAVVNSGSFAATGSGGVAANSSTSSPSTSAASVPSETANSTALLTANFPPEERGRALGAFGAMAFMRNRLYPKGGVRYAIWQVIVYSTPYQIGLNPSLMISGTYRNA